MLTLGGGSGHGLGVHAVVGDPDLEEGVDIVGGTPPEDLEDLDAVDLVLVAGALGDGDGATVDSDGDGAAAGGELNGVASDVGLHGELGWILR